MKKIIILAIATLSTGIVLSNSLSKKEVTAVKPANIEIQKNTTEKAGAKATSFDVVATAD
jgi:cellobiose-specific phosphotransferase system component IIB